jgi:hypothetical protein
MPGMVSGETDLNSLKGKTMKTSMIRSWTVCSLVVSVVISSAFAGDRKYGEAPASLDYPTSATKARVGASSKASKNAIAEMQREELYYLAIRNPFPRTPIAPVHPLTKKKVDGVHVGPAFRTRGAGADFDFYRYVTFYEIDERREIVSSLPVVRQQCHDRSEIFGNYSFNYSYTSSLRVGVTYEGLGIDASYSRTQSETVSRSFPATAGIVADYTPYFVKQDQYGQTFIQTYDSKTGKVSLLAKEVQASAWWVHLLFPIMAVQAYPYTFEILDAKWIFQVERTILERCEGEEEKAAAAGALPTDQTLSLLNRNQGKRKQRQDEIGNHSEH